MAGRRAFPDSSKRTKPCICPVRPIAPIWPPLMPAFSSTDRILAETAAHHSRGSCSDHNGWGVCSVCGDEATAMISPRSSINRALLEVVEVSMPRKYMDAPRGGYPRKEVYMYTSLLSILIFYRTPSKSSTVH